MTRLAHLGRLATVAVLLLALGACSGYRNYRGAQVAESADDWDEAVLRYMELVSQDPSDLRYRSGLLRAKIQASTAHFDKAKKLQEAGLLQQALLELRQAVQLDPTNQYAAVELTKLREQLDAKNGSGAQTLDELKEKTRGSKGQPPVLNPRSKEPIDLDFPEPVSVMQIYQALGKAFGINVLFDPKMRDQDIAIQLKDVVAQDALEILMRSSGHFYKVLDEHSIIVVPDTPQNRRNYEDLIIQTFFLSNSDVKEVMTMLRSLVDARKIAANESLNAIILRDTADKVKVAERIIQANDKAKAEVVVDVELMQLNTSKLQDIGLSLDANQIGVSLDTGGEETPLRFSDVQFLNQNNWLITIPNFLFDFVKNSTDAQTLAKPQLRISEGERARLTIGDRVPIPVTSFNTANTVGSNIVPITSFQYQEVGIRIEIEPRVHHNNEVSLSLNIEVSNINGNIGDQPIIGTRNIETSIRLKDGETNFLAGLIRTDETNSEDGIPGLGEIPVLGRLFSKKRSQNQRTDIVLTLTPHIIRRASITEEDLTPIWVGTEQNITFRGGNSTRLESDATGPFDDPAAAQQGGQQPTRRLDLPRGLEDAGEQGGEQEPETPRGVELVPQSPPGGGNVSLGMEPLPRGATPFALRSALPLMAAGATAMPLSEGEAPVTLELRSAAPRVAPNAEVDIDVHVEASRAVSHLPMTIVYEPESLEVLGVAAGDFLGDESSATVLADWSTPGRLVLGASRLGRSAGVSGGGLVATLKMRTLKAGSTELRIERAAPKAPGLLEVESAVRGLTLAVEAFDRPDPRGDGGP